MTKSDERFDQTARAAWQMMADLVLNNQRRREVSDRVGLSFGRIRALRRIARRPMPMGELATLLTMDPPNLTVVIDDLESAGLVERRVHPTDRRVKLVAATNAGAALAEQAQEILDRPPAGMVELPGEELDTLARILSLIALDRESPA